MCHSALCRKIIIMGKSKFLGNFQNFQKVHTSSQIYFGTSRIVLKFLEFFRKVKFRFYIVLCIIQYYVKNM